MLYLLEKNVKNVLFGLNMNALFGLKKVDKIVDQANR